MDNLDDLSLIRHVQSGDPVAAKITSQPTRAIELRLKELEDRLDALTTRTNLGQLIIYNVPIYTGDDAAVSLYDAVYYNSSDGLYEKALAGVTMVSGIFSSNPTALSLGLVIAVRGSIADVMIGGYSSWPTVKPAIFEAGETFRAGVAYYLSAREAGKLTRFPPSLRIQLMVTTDEHYIVLPSFSAPESIENNFRLPIGMRPVGSVRTIGPDYANNIIVGFDGLELYDTVTGLFRSTTESSFQVYKNFGYVVADAEVVIQPTSPIYVRIQVDTQGEITVISADTLAELYTEGAIHHANSDLDALSSLTYGQVRFYEIYDQRNTHFGTLKFKFTGCDLTYARHVIFKFPADFQGWKMINAPITPSAKATVVAGKVVAIKVVEGSVGYTTPPVVVITGTGTGAAATAELNEFGSIVAVTMGDHGTNPGPGQGSGYSASSVVTFDHRVDGVKVLNGGSGATGTATVANGIVTGVAVTNGGSGYDTPPIVEIVDADGAGRGAVVTAEIMNRQVIKVNVIAGGVDYVAPVVKLTTPNWGYNTTLVNGVPVLPRVSIPGGATADLVLSKRLLYKVEVLCSGGHYSPVTELTVTNTAADAHAPTVKPVIVGGRITDVIVTDPGAWDNEVGAVIATTGGVNGHGARFKLHFGYSVLSAEVTDPGTGYTNNPTTSVSFAIERIRIIGSGAGYLTKPDITISAPPTGGVRATAVARIGKSIMSVIVANGGSGYTNPDTREIVLSAPDLAGGQNAILVPIFSTTGVLETVQIVDPGYGYSTAPTFSSITGVGGSGAELSFAVSGEGQILGVDIVNPGSGYVSMPTVTIDAPVSGTRATAEVLQTFEPAVLEVELAGAGGIRMVQAASADTSNNLQIVGYREDTEDTNADFIKPTHATLYYNIKADPNLNLRYPAVPVEKCNFVQNGVELQTSLLTERTGALADSNADIGLSRKTLFWTAFDANGSPWDQAYAHYVLDRAAGGRDHIIPATGVSGDTDGMWRLFEQLYKYEVSRNVAWLHINRASRFYQSSRVTSIGAVAPLKLVNVATGIDTSDDGSPMTGQLILTIDNQINLLGTSGQIDLSNPNELQVIYQNTTGKLVIISSILLTVIYHLNTAGLKSTVENCAQITVGTENGSYRDIIGITAAAIASTRLFAVNQVKELFPDADNAYTMIAPNQSIYLRVASAAGAPIVKQIVIARVKGHAF